MSRIAALLIALMLTALPARATEPVPVVASILPLHSLVAGVMEGVGTPYLLIRGGASPHAGALRPSDALRVQEAGAVFWIGENLEIFLARPLAALARPGRTLALIKAKGLRLLPLRRDKTWNRGDDDHGHDYKSPHGIDTHIWLDPGNAKILVRVIAEKLQAADPAHASRFAANAAALFKRLDALDRSLKEILTPVRGVPYIVFHDAYQYFETHFGLTPTGTITLGPGRAPGARHLRIIRDRIRSSGVRCIFVEPQFTPRLANIVVEGTGARIGVLDPLGAALPPGKDAYFILMKKLAENLRDCLSIA